MKSDRRVPTFAPVTDIHGSRYWVNLDQVTSVKDIGNSESVLMFNNCKELVLKIDADSVLESFDDFVSSFDTEEK